MNGCNSQPLVSVIITTYNCGRYIAQAVDSLLAQTYGRCEIIVVDDGSEDDTAQVLARYGDRLRIFRQPNLGLSRARNEALKHCNGKYIAFLDADDHWKPYKLEMQVAILENLPQVGLLFTNFDVMDEDGTLLEEFAIERGFSVFKEYGLKIKEIFDHTEHDVFSSIHGDRAEDNFIYYGNIFEHLFKGNFVLPSTEMFRAECLSEELKFNEDYRCATDQDFHLKFSRRHLFAYVDTSTIRYRTNRKDRLSGNRNAADLIANTIESREKMLLEEPLFAKEKAALVSAVMARLFSRLAYYHLSIVDTDRAASCARRSLDYDHWHTRAWAVLFLAQAPVRVLQVAGKIKRAAA